MINEMDTQCHHGWMRSAVRSNQTTTRQNWTFVLITEPTQCGVWQIPLMLTEWVCIIYFVFLHIKPFIKLSPRWADLYMYNNLVLRNRLLMFFQTCNMKIKYTSKPSKYLPTPTKIRIKMKNLKIFFYLARFWNWTANLTFITICDTLSISYLWNEGQ